MALRVTPSGLSVLAALALQSAGARAQDAPPEAPPVPVPWYEALRLSAFVDAYAGVNYNLPRPEFGTNATRAYDGANGFALSWVGADVGKDATPLGGRLSLRLGPTAERRGGSCLSADRSASPCDGDVGLANVNQAFAAWRPGGADAALELRFGKFAGIYGAEVAEAQRDFDYTRGLLYRYAVPWFFTGLMATWRPNRVLSIDALVVNGYNATIDNNVGKTFGVRAEAVPNDWLDVSLGWLGGPEQDDQLQVHCPAYTSYSGPDKSCIYDAQATQGDSYTVDRGGANQLRAWRHLVDFVVRLRAGELVNVVANADYGQEGVRSVVSGTTGISNARWYGASLGARWEFVTDWTAAARVEALRDERGRATGIDGATLGSVTLTLATRVAERLSLMLDNRVDAALNATAGTDVFDVGARDRSARQITSTLGVIVSTD